VNQQVSELEQRLTELQAQIDQLTLSLHLWRENQDRLQPTEDRLSELTDRAADILEQWSSSGARHARAIGELEARLHDLSSLEARMQHNAAESVRELERGIEREWTALREIHEMPARQLTEQAANLTEVAVTAAASAQRGFDRAEARLATIETDLHHRMGELTQELRTVVAELRASRGAPQLPGPAAASWPLEGVMRLHNELRQSTEGSADEPAKQTPTPESPQPKHDEEDPDMPPARFDPREPIAAAPLRLLPAAASSLSDRIQTLEQAINDGQTSIRENSELTMRTWRIALAVVLAGVLVGGGLLWTMQRQVDVSAARAADAEQQARQATEAANKQMTSARAEAAQQIAEARDAAQKARIVSEVVASMDTVRYLLFGGDGKEQLSAQFLWSRSHGFVFSGSRLPPPAAGSTYQLWLSTATGPVSAGAFAPDSAGRVTLATDPPTSVSRVLGAFVTVEPTGGREKPSGPMLLARIQTPAPAAPPDEPVR